MHSQLQLVKGIQRAPGDTYSLESDYTIVDLLSGSGEGFALNTSPSSWNPAIAQPKNGLWYETPFTDGRTLFAGADQNVTETLSLTLTAPNAVRLAAYMRQLGQMQDDCLRFWQDEHMQYDPVFLWWMATGAPGPQYALIYQIQVSVDIPTTSDDGTVVRGVTLTLEREPYWRAIPPGANPVTWTLYRLGEQPGLNYTYSDGKLNLSPAANVNPSRSLVNATLQNRVEADLSGTTTTLRTQNFCTIPADKIPGDAPALLQMSFATSPSIEKIVNAFVAVRSGAVSKAADPTVGPLSSGFLFFPVLPVLAANANTSMATPPSLAGDTGGVQGYSYWDTLTYNTSQRAVITPTTTEETALRFSGNRALHGMLQRGRFAVFMRCRQNGGSLGDIQVRLAVEDGNYPVTNWTSVPLQAGSGNTTSWETAYLGQIEFPIDTAAPMSYFAENLTQKLGGIGISHDSNTFDLALNVIRSTGSAVLYIADIILMPIDEGFIDVNISRNDLNNLMIDNTGYMTHGKPGTVGIAGTYNSRGYAEIKGSELTLQPNVDNHVMFIYRDENNDSKARVAFSVWVNIVPRWRYIREV